MIMHLSEILAAELDAFRQRTGKEKLNIVETGSIRGEGDNYRQNDGWSTVTFAEHIKEHGGSLTSIDLDIETADKVLRSKKLRSQVTLIEGHSIDVLSALLVEAASKDKTPFDVAFLDSDNDGALIFHEYLIARKLTRSPGLILVDDVDLLSTEVVKGHEILPWARANNIPHRIIERGNDHYRTGVLVFEV
jgi:cephalosporin hydroxylase